MTLGPASGLCGGRGSARAVHTRSLWMLTGLLSVMQSADLAAGQPISGGFMPETRSVRGPGTQNGSSGGGVPLALPGTPPPRAAVPVGTPPATVPIPVVSLPAASVVPAVAPEASAAAARATQAVVVASAPVRAPVASAAPTFSLASLAPIVIVPRVAIMNTAINTGPDEVSAPRRIEEIPVREAAVAPHEKAEPVASQTPALRSIRKLKQSGGRKTRMPEPMAPVEVPLRIAQYGGQAALVLEFSGGRGVGQTADLGRALVTGADPAPFANAELRLYR